MIEPLKSGAAEKGTSGLRVMSCDTPQVTASRTCPLCLLSHFGCDSSTRVERRCWLPEACCTTGGAGPRGSRRRGWTGPSSGKKEGNDRDRLPRLLMSTALRESECSAFIRLTTLVPYFNARCLIYSTNRLAGGRAWKVLESINLTFQCFFWWDWR